MSPLSAFCVASFSLAAAFAGSPTASRASEACPEHLTENGKFHMLQDMKIYDGAEAAESEIVPALSGKTASWDISAVRAAGADPQLRCSFKHTGKTQSSAVPEDAKKCNFVATYPAKATCD